MSNHFHKITLNSINQNGIQSSSKALLLSKKKLKSNFYTRVQSPRINQNRNPQLKTINSNKNQNSNHKHYDTLSSLPKIDREILKGRLQSLINKSILLTKDQIDTIKFKLTENKFKKTHDDSDSSYEERKPTIKPTFKFNQKPDILNKDYQHYYGFEDYNTTMKDILTKNFSENDIKMIIEDHKYFHLNGELLKESGYFIPKCLKDRLDLEEIEQEKLKNKEICSRKNSKNVRKVCNNIILGRDCFSNEKNKDCKCKSHKNSKKFTKNFSNLSPEKKSNSGLETESTSTYLNTFNNTSTYSNNLIKMNRRSKFNIKTESIANCKNSTFLTMRNKNSVIKTETYKRHKCDLVNKRSKNNLKEKLINRKLNLNLDKDTGLNDNDSSLLDDNKLEEQAPKKKKKKPILSLSPEERIKLYTERKQCLIEDRIRAFKFYNQKVERVKNNKNLVDGKQSKYYVERILKQIKQNYLRKERPDNYHYKNNFNENIGSQ